jgi:hypothetical protein
MAKFMHKLGIYADLGELARRFCRVLRGQLGRVVASKPDRVSKRIVVIIERTVERNQGKLSMQYNNPRITRDAPARVGRRWQPLPSGRPPRVWRADYGRVPSR